MMAKKLRELPASPFAGHLLCAAEMTLLLQLFATAIVFNAYFTNPLVNKFLLAQSLSVIAWVLYLSHCCFARRYTLVWSPYYIPAILLSAWAGIRAVTSPDAMALWTFYIFFTILLSFPLWLTLFQSSQFKKWYVYTVTLTGFLVFLGCLRQLFYHLFKDPAAVPPLSLLQIGTNIVTLTPGSYERQYLGSFMGHNNFSSSYLVITALFVFVMLYWSRRSKWGIFFSIFLCLNFFMIIYAGSRGAFLMIPPALLLLGYGWLRQSRFQSAAQSLQPAFKPILMALGGIVFVVIAALIAANAIGGSAIDNVFTRFFISREFDLAGTYPRVWTLSLYMFFQNPFTGIGFGAWAHQYPYYQESWFALHPDTLIGLPDIGKHTERAHNDYLQITAELGLPALFFLLWMILIFLRHLRSFFRQTITSLLPVAAAAGVLAALVQSIFAFPFYIAPSACLFNANLALFSHYMPNKVYTFKPALFQQARNPSRWWVFALHFMMGVILLYPAGIFTRGDMYARLKENMFSGKPGVLQQATQALEQGNNEHYQHYLEQYYKFNEDGLKALERSFNYLPNRGYPLYNYGIEILGIGLEEQNEETLKHAITIFERSLGSYVYYDTFTYLGKAYQKLWELRQDKEYLNKALENFERAVSIMPTFYQGWINYGLLLADAGQGQKSIDILAETELRFPGFIEEGVFAAAHQTEAELHIEKAALLYNLAIVIQPDNPRLFQSIYNDEGALVSKGVIDFYLDINRLDRASLTLAGTAPFQEPDAVMQETTKVLMNLLTRKQYNDAHDMMTQMLSHESMTASSQLHYYAAVVAWLAGDADSCFIHCRFAHELGVPLKQMQTLMQSALDLSHTSVDVY